MPMRPLFYQQHVAFQVDQIAPIPGQLRQELESAFCSDFNDVTLHIGPAPRALGMAAFACGSQIHIDPLHYRLGESGFESLLAHELAHVVQQRCGRTGNHTGPGPSILEDPALEFEAELAAQTFIASPCGRERGALAALLAPAIGPANPALVIQPLVMHGVKPIGGFGALTVNEMRDWIANKIVRVGVSPANVLNCANYIQGYPAGAAGGGTALFYHGQNVKHISHGLMGGGLGCTVFFVNSQADHARIIGIGWHHAGSPTRYDLDWGVGSRPWVSNTTVCTVHGFHCLANH